VVAVKQFSTYDRDVFQNELHVLRNLRKRRHFHLHRITLLASYEQANQLYLILPWAEVDLEQYWKSKWPTAPPEIASWIKQQCCGIVEAVSHIHRYKTFSGTTMLDTNRPTSVRKESGQSTASTGRRQRTLFGRHGDIKPANILWFPGPSSDTLFGILKVSDFGTARFSDNEQVAVEDKSSVPNSRAYQSPECVLPDGKISSQCDVWALGCVFLEFVCWYFGGRELLLTFERDRRHFYETASFFTTMKHDTPPLVCAELKPPVTEVSLHLLKIVGPRLNCAIDDWKIEE
jgi:serine/threonine protein kinase